MSRRIIIIGASSGIGLKSALYFADKGWKVGIAARRASQLIAVKNQYPQNVEMEVIDIAADDASSKIKRLIDRLGGVDIYFHAAGTGWSNPTLDLDKEMTTIATNVRGFVTSMVTAYRYFVDNNLKGRIVAITSVAGTKGIGISASYSATKLFESTYIESLDQLARIDKADVSFTDIRPGFIRTDLLDSSRNYPMLMKLDYAVKRIVKAVVSGGQVVYIDCRWGLLVFLWKLIPPCLWRRLPIKL